MINEFIFLLQVSSISLCSLIALRLGKEALVAYICICCLLANLFVLKQISLFGLFATSSDAFSVGATLGLNMLQEYFGKPVTRTAIWINFFLLIFYAFIAQVHLAYLPSGFDTTQPHFAALLVFMPRIVVASFTVYLIAQLTDYYLYGFLRKTWRRRFLLIINYISTLTSQLVDTVLFTLLGLYGILSNLGHIMVVSYMIKFVAILIAIPFIWFSRTLNIRDTDIPDSID